MNSCYKSLLFIILINLLASKANSSSHVCIWRGCKNGPGSLECQSCIHGCYGSQCSHTCKGKCNVDGCHRKDGVCFRCKPGYHGEMCNIRCPAHCSSTINDGVADCDRDTGFCKEHCSPGMTGPNCSVTCPPNCKTSVCAKLGGTCSLGCKPGWRGPYCDISCDTCLEGRCADNGYCTINCKPGFYGDLCDKICSKNGERCHRTGCDRQTGRCDQCFPGYHGEHCDKKCNSNCHKGGDNHRDCARDNGQCLEGCETGWHGLHCITPCSENCIDKECYNPHGRCTHGCKTGFYGSHCHRECSGHCLSGSCHQHNGHCSSGCNKGYFGKNCEKTCNSCDKCEQDSGQCTKCPKGFWGITCSENCSKNCHEDTCDIKGHCTNGCKKNTYYGYQCENQCAQDCLKCEQLTGNCTVKNVERQIGNENSEANSCEIHNGLFLIIVFCLTVSCLLFGDVP